MIKIKTEVQDYIRRLSVLNPEKDISMIDGRDRIEIYSIGGDGHLYLCYECSGHESQFTRILIRKNVNEFTATNIAGTNKVAIACCDANNVFLAITEEPEKVTEDDFVRLDFDGVLGGKKLNPSELLLSALDKGITLFVEMRDEGGRIEQFSCLLDSSSPTAIKYFPLAANFSTVKCSEAGRAVGQYVDGIYSYGNYGDTDQMLYTPSTNVFGATPPAPIRLKTDYVVDTICALSLVNKVGTHLLSVGEKSLFVYPFDRQKDMHRISNPDPDLMITSELFNEAKKISAVRFDDKVYVYVLNQANILSYTFADYKNDAFSEFVEPVRLMENVFYFDISDQGSMNICKSDSAVFGKRNSMTGEWSFQDVCLETSLDEYHKESAFVTRITVDKPFDEIVIEFNNGKQGCYVNDIYHQFHSMPARLDSTGAIKIVQTATTLTPPSFTVKIKDESVKVNPAEEMQKQVLSLTDVDTLKKQMIVDPQGRTRHLFGEGADDSGLSMVSSSISALCGSMNSILPGFVAAPINFAGGVIIKITDTLVNILPYDVTHNPFMDFIGKVVKDVAYAVGWVVDQVKWLYDHTIKKAVDFAIGLVGKVWKFIVKIGDKVLEVVVDSIEKVFSTAIKILEAIGIPIGEIFDWLKKALGIDETLKMNDCMKKVMHLSGKKLAETAIEIKEDVIEALDKAVDSIAEWANIDLDAAKSYIDNSSSKSALAFDCGPQGTYMFDTIYGALAPDSIQLPSFTPTKQMNDTFDVFLDTVQEFEKDITETTSIILSIGDDFENIFKSGDIQEVCVILKQILGKVAISGIELCKAFIKPIFDLVASTIETLAELLCEPIHIPLISDILKIFGINEFSIADLVTFPTSFLATTVSRIVTGKGLISDSMYNSIMNAETLDEAFLPAPIKKESQVLLRAARSEAVEDTEETTYLCDEKSRKMVVAFKSIISAFAYAELIVDGFSKVSSYKSKGKGKANTYVSFLATTFTMIDFGFSYASGSVYSPMDTDDDNEYRKQLEAVKYCISVYSTAWMTKSICSMIKGCAEIPLTHKFKDREIYGLLELISKVSSGVQFVFCGLGFVSEVVGEGIATSIDTDKAPYKDASRDKQVFLSDTAGYFLDDVRSMLDIPWDLGLSKVLGSNPYVALAYVGIRDVCALGYAGSMTATAIIMNKKE